MSLELEFEIEDIEDENEEESLSSIASSNGTEMDIDDGELGEYISEDEAKSDAPRPAQKQQLLLLASPSSAEVAAAIAYLHEPVARQDLQNEQANYGDARPRGNLDDTRLDPENTANWYVIEKDIYFVMGREICLFSWVGHHSFLLQLTQCYTIFFYL